MKYELENKSRITATLSKRYLNDHIFSSLENFFSKHTDDVVQCFLDASELEDSFRYPLLRITDIASPEFLLEFYVKKQIKNTLILYFCGGTINLN